MSASQSDACRPLLFCRGRVGLRRGAAEEFPCTGPLPIRLGASLDAGVAPHHKTVFSGLRVQDSRSGMEMIGFLFGVPQAAGVCWGLPPHPPTQPPPPPPL